LENANDINLRDEILKIKHFHMVLMQISKNTEIPYERMKFIFKERVGSVENLDVIEKHLKKLLANLEYRR
jgi:hypothetical protein